MKLKLFLLSLIYVLLLSCSEEAVQPPAYVFIKPVIEPGLTDSEMRQVFYRVGITNIESNETSREYFSRRDFDGNYTTPEIKLPALKPGRYKFKVTATFGSVDIGIESGEYDVEGNYTIDMLLKKNEYGKLHFSVEVPDERENEIYEIDISPGPSNSVLIEEEDEVNKGPVYEVGVYERKNRYYADFTKITVKARNARRHWFSSEREKRTDDVWGTTKVYVVLSDKTRSVELKIPTKAEIRGRKGDEIFDYLDPFNPYPLTIDGARINLIAHETYKFTPVFTGDHIENPFFIWYFNGEQIMNTSSEYINLLTSIDPGIYHLDVVAQNETVKSSRGFDFIVEYDQGRPVTAPNLTMNSMTNMEQISFIQRDAGKAGLYRLDTADLSYEEVVMTSFRSEMYSVGYSSVCPAVFHADGNYTFSGKNNKLIRDDIQEGSLRISPDGRRIAYVEKESGRLVISPIDTNQTTIIDDNPFDIAGLYYINWSRDSGYLVYKRSSDLVIHNIENSERYILFSEEQWLGSPMLSPDNSKLLYHDQKYNVVLLFDTISQEILPFEREGEIGAGFQSYVWSPQGDRFCYTLKGDIYISDLNPDSEPQLVMKSENLKTPFIDISNLIWADRDTIIFDDILHSNLYALSLIDKSVKQIGREKGSAIYFYTDKPASVYIHDGEEYHKDVTVLRGVTEDGYTNSNILKNPVILDGTLDLEIRGSTGMTLYIKNVWLEINYDPWILDMELEYTSYWDRNDDGFIVLKPGESLGINFNKMPEKTEVVKIKIEGYYSE